MNKFISRLSKEIDTVIDKSKLDKSYSKKKAIFLSTYCKLMSYFNIKLDNLKFEAKKLGKLSLMLSMNQIDSKLINEITADGLCEEPNVITTTNECESEFNECLVNTGNNFSLCNEMRLRRINSSNIIDNIMFVLPMSIMASEYASKVPEAINYSNVATGSNYRSELLLTMYEKFNKKTMPVQTKKAIKTCMYLYDLTKKNICKYV